MAAKELSSDLVNKSEQLKKSEDCNKNDLFNLTNGSLSLSRKFINHELYEIQDHFRELLNDRKLIKSNTASHYSNFISKIFAKDEDISIFFDYIYLITSYEVKSMARQGKEREVLNLLKISEIVKTYRNYFKSFSYFHITIYYL